MLATFDFYVHFYFYCLEEEAPDDDGSDEEQEEPPADPISQPVTQSVHSHHVKCAAHRLNSCLRETFEKNVQMEKLRKRVYKVIGKFAKSHRATKMLYDESRSRNPNKRGLKLLFPANTRWASAAVCYGRVLRLEESLKVVCEELDFPSISANDFARMRNAVQIIGAFRGFIIVLQNQSTPTVSLVLPGVQSLIRLLELKKAEGVLRIVCDSLIKGLTRRFADVLSSGKPGTDPLYLVAACLDPLVQKREGVLDDDFTLASTAIRDLAVTLRLDVASDVAVLQEVNEAAEKSPYGFTVPPKRARVSAGSQTDKLKNEIIEYRALMESEDVSDSLGFWFQHKQQFSLLSKLAFNILSVPGASSAVEQLFSLVSLHSTGRKAASGPKTIARKSLLNFNEKFIDI